MPIPYLQREFERLNPGTPLDIIDWKSYYDPEASDRDNLAIFKEAYGGFTWFASPQVERQAREELSAKLKENIDLIEFAIDSVPTITDEDKKRLIDSIRDLGKRAINSLALQRSVNRLRKQLTQAQTEAQKRALLNTLVPAGPVKTIPTERPTPVIPPTTARPQERYANILASRILSENNLFTVLGIVPRSTDEEVRKARNQLLTLFHPDVFPNTELGTRVSQKINAAYDSLETERQRMEYERTLRPPQTVKVEAGTPTLYCESCTAQGMVLMEFDRTFGPFKTGSKYVVYKCPTPGCREEAIITFKNDVFQGVGRGLRKT